MISLDLATLAEIVGAESVAPGAGRFSGVTIDSRQSCDGMLFVALKGENFDGHQFIEAAMSNGAVAALVEEPQDCAITQLKVADCKQAMARLANHWRHHCDPLVVALTGSNGKTTVKEMLYQILDRKAPTLATRGNFNNDIGVPLTLFRLSPEQTYAVIEMGANHKGEIARLVEIAEPDIVYVNNVAAAHLAGFGSIQGVVEAKGEIYDWCGSEQRALFNVDEVASQYWRQRCAAERTLDCGIDKPADVSASWSMQETRLIIDFKYGGETSRSELAVVGEHNVRNALAAVSLALLAGLDLAEAAANLAGFSGVKGRLQILSGPAQSRLIDDSYNANPESLMAGIRVACSMPGEAWLALGDMGELGEDEVELHREAGRGARREGVHKLFGVGAMSAVASEEFGDGGSSYDDIESMADAIRAQIYPGVNLLVKGSRSAGMDRLVSLLAATNGE